MLDLKRTCSLHSSVMAVTVMDSSRKLGSIMFIEILAAIGWAATSQTHLRHEFLFLVFILVGTFSKA